MGTPESDVTHSGGGPWTFVASQPRGNAGGVRLSKFSVNTTGIRHGGAHGGVDCGIATRWAMAREETIPPNIAMPAATKKSEQRIFSNRGRVNIRSGFAIIQGNVLAKSAEICQTFSMVKDRAGAPDAAVVVASLRRGASGGCCSWQHGDTALWPQQRLFLRWLPIASLLLWWTRTRMRRRARPRCGSGSGGWRWCYCRSNSWSHRRSNRWCGRWR